MLIAVISRKGHYIHDHPTQYRPTREKRTTFQVRLKVLNYMVTFIKKATNYAHKNAIRIPLTFFLNHDILYESPCCQFVHLRHRKWPSAEDTDIWFVQLESNWTEKTTDFVCQLQSSWTDQKPVSSAESHLLCIKPIWKFQYISKIWPSRHQNSCFAMYIYYLTLNFF